MLPRSSTTAPRTSFHSRLLTSWPRIRICSWGSQDWRESCGAALQWCLREPVGGLLPCDRQPATPLHSGSACASLSLSIAVFMRQLTLVLSTTQAALGTGRLNTASSWNPTSSTPQTTAASPHAAFSRHWSSGVKAKAAGRPWQVPGLPLQSPKPPRQHAWKAACML